MLSLTSGDGSQTLPFVSAISASSVPAASCKSASETEKLLESVRPTFVDRSVEGFRTAELVDSLPHLANVHHFPFQLRVLGCHLLDDYI